MSNRATVTTQASGFLWFRKTRYVVHDYRGCYEGTFDTLEEAQHVAGRQNRQMGPEPKYRLFQDVYGKYVLFAKYWPDYLGKHVTVGNLVTTDEKGVFYRRLKACVEFKLFKKAGFEEDCFDDLEEACKVKFKFEEYLELNNRKPVFTPVSCDT